MTRITLILFLILLGNLTYGQTNKESFWKPYIEKDFQEVGLVSLDSLKFEKAYRIWNSYQIIELIKLSDDNYQGQLVNFVHKLNVREESKGILYQKLLISDKVVKELMDKLADYDIEILPDSYEVKGYINGSDGTTYVFEISKPRSNRYYSYWEPENENYQDSNLKEVQNVRGILNAINSEFDLWRKFKLFRDNLSFGKYQYGMIILEVE